MFLNDKRKEIDKIDEKLIELLNKRLIIVENIKNYKAENNIAIFDAKREEEIINKYAIKYQESKNWPFIEQFLKELIKIAKKYQNEL